MAIFSCVHQGDQYATLPRGSKGSSGRPGLPSGTSSSPRLGGNGTPRAVSGQNLSGRSGGPSKLQKRAKVSKTMIGTPRDFQHLTHMNKTDAQRVRNSKEMNEVTEALRFSANDLTQKENVAPPALAIAQMQPHSERFSMEDETPRDEAPPQPPNPTSAREPLHPRRASAAVVPMTVARRKAPPPITPSIIKAAGLPANAAGSQPIVLPANATIVARNNKRTSLFPVLADTPLPPPLQEQDSLAPPTSIQDPSLPATNSSIQRTAISDIERLLDAPIDGMPASSTSLEASSAPGAPLPAHIPEPSGTVRSTTLQNLALSPSMENVVHEAIIVDDGGGEEEQNKAAGPLMYMTGSTKAKWDGQMEDIARQLREE